MADARHPARQVGGLLENRAAGATVGNHRVRGSPTSRQARPRHCGLDGGSDEFRSDLRDDARSAGGDSRARGTSRKATDSARHALPPVSRFSASLPTMQGPHGGSLVPTTNPEAAGFRRHSPTGADGPLSGRRVPHPFRASSDPLEWRAQGYRAPRTRRRQRTDGFRSARAKQLPLRIRQGSEVSRRVPGSAAESLPFRRRPLFDRASRVWEVVVELHKRETRIVLSVVPGERHSELQ